MLASAIWLFAIAAAFGCTRSGPARIVAGLDDTVIINSTRATLIPVDAVDRSGRTTPVTSATFKRMSGDTIHISADGKVRCTRAGDATVRATLGTASTTFVLYCRPMRHLKYANDNYGLFVGGSPRPIDVVGVGLDGRPVTLLAARISVLDSSIVGVEHGHLTPKRRGMTTILVEAGDDHIRYVVQVLERSTVSDRLEPQQAFIDRVTLGSGGVRSWPVGRGRYEVSFFPDDTARGRALLTANGANCARYPDGGSHLSCVVRDAATIYVALPQASGARAPVTGQVVIRRMADSTLISDYWFDARAYALAR